MSRPPVRVLTVLDRLRDAGGAERVAVDLALGLDPERFSARVCATRPLDADGAQSAARLAAAGIPLRVLERRRALAPGALLGLARAIHRERVDVVHGHMLGPSAWAAVAGTLGRAPAIVAHEHGSPAAVGRGTTAVERLLLGRAADAVVAVSRPDLVRLRDASRVPADKLVLLPNGLDPRPPLGTDVRAELGIAPGTPLLVTVCRIRAEKRLDVLVEALAALRRDGAPDAELLIAGEGDAEPELRAAIARLGLGDAVHLPGRRADVPDVLAAGDVFVLSSDREGSPIALLEAMEAGLPIAATAVGGVPDAIEDGVQGLLVAPGDPAALAAAVRRLLDEPEAAAAMGRSAQARRRAEFSLTAVVRRVEELYGRLVSSRRSPRQTPTP